LVCSSAEAPTSDHCSMSLIRNNQQLVLNELYRQLNASTEVMRELIEFFQQPGQQVETTQRGIQQAFADVLDAREPLLAPLEALIRKLDDLPRASDPEQSGLEALTERLRSLLSQEGIEAVLEHRLEQEQVLLNTTRQAQQEFQDEAMPSALERLEQHLQRAIERLKTCVQS